MLEHQERIACQGRNQALRTGLRLLHALQSARRGVTAVEYGIVAAFLCLSLLGIFRAFGSVLVTMFSGVTSGI